MVMKHFTSLFKCPEAPSRHKSNNERIVRVAVLVKALFFFGIILASAALGSHTTLPGSHDLHPSGQIDHERLTRQLNVINQYSPSHSQPDREENTRRTSKPLPSMPPSLHPGGTRNSPSSLSPPSRSPTTENKRPTVGPLPSAQDHVDLGWTFLLNGRPQAAMAAYREALRRHPFSAKAHMGMGMTFKSLDQVEEAKQAMHSALDLNPRLSSALVHLGYLYADGDGGLSDPQTARQLFQQALRLGDPFAGIALLDLQLP